MATKYISVSGSGDGSGSDIDNCINGNGATNSAGLRAAIQGASSGDVFRVVEGTYIFTDNAFTISAPLSIIGYTSGDAESSTPAVILTGTAGTTYLYTNSGAYTKNGITFAVSVDNIVLKHLNVKIFQKCLNAGNGKNRDITITDCKFEYCKDAIYIKGLSTYTPGSGTAPASTNSQRWTVTNITVQNFANTGIWISHGCQDLTFNTTYCYGDGDSYTACTVNSTTDRFTTTSHGLVSGDFITFNATTFPTGISKFKRYKVVRVDDDTFTVTHSPTGDTNNGGVFTAPTITSSGTAVTWRKTFNNNAQQQWGVHVGNSSGGQHTTDLNINFTNFYGSWFQHYIYSVASYGSYGGDNATRIGEGITTENTTTGSINGGYIEYSSDAAVDCKGDWTVSNMVLARSHTGAKSYSAAPQRITLNNCLIIGSQNCGGTQGTQAVKLFGFMTMNNCTVWGHGDATELIKFQALWVANLSLTLNDCIIGWTDSTSPSIVRELQNGSPATSASPPIVDSGTNFWNDSGVLDWNGAAVDTDPDFVSEDLNYTGGNTNWNPQAGSLAQSKGWWYDSGETPDPGGDITVITITGVNMSGVTFS